MSVDRIGTLFQSQSLLNELMRAQRNMLETQTQIATGRKVDELKDAGAQASVLLAARAQDVRAQAYAATGTELSSRLEQQDILLSGFADAAAQVRQTIMDAVAANSGAGLMERLDGLFQSAVQALNTKAGSMYLFGGIRTDVPPVNVTTLEQLRTAPTLAGVFENAAVPLSAAVDEGQVLQYGFLANDVGQELFGILRAVAEFTNLNGPFGPQLTGAQAAFLETQIGPAKTALENVSEVQARNGNNQQVLDDALARHKDIQIVAKRLVSDIEDVDIAEALARLSRDQLATQAATKVIADLSRISLLDYLS